MEDEARGPPLAEAAEEGRVGPGARLDEAERLGEEATRRREVLAGELDVRDPGDAHTSTGRALPATKSRTLKPVSAISTLSLSGVPHTIGFQCGSKM